MHAQLGLPAARMSARAIAAFKCRFCIQEKCCFTLKFVLVMQGIGELWKILMICIENINSACADAEFVRCEDWISEVLDFIKRQF